MAHPETCQFHHLMEVAINPGHCSPRGNAVATAQATERPLPDWWPLLMKKLHELMVSSSILMVLWMLVLMADYHSSMWKHVKAISWMLSRNPVSHTTGCGYCDASWAPKSENSPPDVSSILVARKRKGYQLRKRKKNQFWESPSLVKDNPQPLSPLAAGWCVRMNWVQHQRTIIVIGLSDDTPQGSGVGFLDAFLWWFWGTRLLVCSSCTQK